MVVFPLGKLVYLGIKQISKPVANQIKQAAKHSAFFSKYICSPPAQGLHRLEMFVKFRLMGAKGPVEYKPLSQEKAVELGSEMLGEFFLYATAATYIFYEYWKGVQKDRERDNTQDEQGVSLNVLHDQIITMEKEMKNMTVKLTKLQENLDSKSSLQETKNNNNSSSNVKKTDKITSNKNNT